MSAPRQRAGRAAALVSVLTVVSIVSVMVVVFLTVTRFEFASSSAYSQSLVAEELARGAGEEIVAQLADEARQATESSTAGDVLGLLPVRVGVAETDPRVSPLVRRSAHMDDAAFDALFTAGGVGTPPPNLASDVSTDTPGPDGHYLSVKRWSAPRLLPETVTLAVPDWIYVTRSGPKKVADGDVATLRDLDDPDNYEAVIGRFAYTIYDTGGLLDANVAGSPVGAGGGAKGASALADLAPLFTEVGGDAAAFLNWRNANATTFFEDIYGVAVQPGQPAEPGALEEGLRELQPGNNAVFSRQELIKYATDHPSTLPLQALPYFTTFSRAANAPEIDEATPGRPGYLENAATREITAYELDGSPGSYTVKGGDPFLQRKFPLARLRWFGRRGTHGSPLEDYTEAIHQHFGLRWVDDMAGAGLSVPEYQGTGGFVYTSPDGDTPANTIKTLAEVAGRGREPDFFEWLKAAIDEDSLGITGGSPFTSLATARDASRDFQILQIGANIIDQADADDVPTLLATGVVANRRGEPQVAMGVENLPYINEFIVSFHRPTSNLDQLHAYLQFELWNPHQDTSVLPQDFTGSPLSGQRFRIRAVEGRPWVETYVRINRVSDTGDVQGGVIVPVKEFSSFNREIVPKTFNPSADVVTFAYDEQDFSEPRLLGDNPASDEGVMLGRSGRVVRAGPRPGESGFKGIDAGYARAPNPGIPAGTQLASTLTVPSPLVVPAVPPPAPPLIVGAPYPMGEKYYNTVMFLSTPAPVDVTNPPAQEPQPVTLVAEMQLADGTWVPYQTLEDLRADGSGLKDIDYPTSVRHGGAGGAVPNLGWNPINAFDDNTPQNTSQSWDTTHWANPGAAGSQRPFGTVMTGPVTGFSYSGWDHLRYHMSAQRVDPRSRRFGLPYNVGTWGASSGLSMRDSATVWNGSTGNSNWDVVQGLSLPGGSANTVLPEMARNVGASGYNDRDGVRRPADWAYLTDTAFPTIPGQTAARPVVLNRPFRSVAELGYVFRDLPWRSLDFFSPVTGSGEQSADLRLLDVFCVEDHFAAAGKVNPNTASRPVLEALLTGSALNAAPFAVSAGAVGGVSTVAENLATTVSVLDDQTAVRTTSDLVRRLMDNATVNGNPNKISREAFARGLVGAVDARTWNLLIDVVAQSGRFPPSAATLAMFQPSGERRYWIHVAIDRATGRIIDTKYEPVYE